MTADFKASGDNSPQKNTIGEPLRRPKNRVLDIAIGAGSLSRIISRSVQSITNSATRPLVFACANPHSLATATRDNAFKRALQDADIVVADGVGVSLAGLLLGYDVGPRITGSDYFKGLLTRLDEQSSARVFFFGSSESVLQSIRERFTNDYPNLILCGTLSPPYRPWSDAENSDMIARINSARPDVLFVGMTAPKQEKWVANNVSQVDSRIIASIGAVFDFYAGTYRRAPAFVNYLGLEWLFRFLKEPHRLWRRTFISLPWFLVIATCCRIKQLLSGKSGLNDVSKVHR